MDLPLGQPSGGTVRPRGDELFAPKLAEDRFLAMNRTHAAVCDSNCGLCSIVLTP